MENTKDEHEKDRLQDKLIRFFHERLDPFENKTTVLQNRNEIQQAPEKIMAFEDSMEQKKNTEIIVENIDNDAEEQEYRRGREEKEELEKLKKEEQDETPAAALIFPQNERGMTWKQHVLDKSNSEFDPVQKQSSKKKFF